MPDSSELFMTKHLARNVPVDFNACVERERFSVAGPPHRHQRRSHLFKEMIACLTEDGSVTDLDTVDLNDNIVEIQIRYLVLSKTLDQSIPPTPIMRALKTLRRKAAAVEATLNDPDRDDIVRDMAGLEPDAPIPSNYLAFLSGQSFAEKAAIAHQIVLRMSEELQDMTPFFDYKAGMTPRGNQTKFATIYVVGALADMFERENTWGRKSAVNLGIDLRIDAETGEYYRFTGKFLRFVIEFFHRVDDAQMCHLEGNSFAERLRQLISGRKKDPDLFQLLHGDVSVDVMLEFMHRAEGAR